MQIIILLVALSIDVFVASFSCGMGKIKIRLIPAICISSVCSGILALSLTIGTFIDGVIDEKYTTIMCFWGLFLIGFVKMVEFGIKTYIKKYKQIKKQIHLKFKQLNLVINIYNNPQSADADNSKDMSVSESVFFALAMSVDGLFGGIGAAFLKINIPITIAINFIIGLALVIAGHYMGDRTSRKTDKDFGWLSGALFIILAFRKII